MSSFSAPTPRYQSHKKVWALAIVAVSGPILIVEEPFAPKVVGPEWISRHNPQPGGYWIQYEDGYTSYSPKEAFEAGHTLITGSFDFGQAIKHLKAGRRVARRGWNGKGMWIALTQGSTIPAELARSGAVKAQVECEDVASVEILSHIDMRAADGSIVVGWLASQTDMLAEDWELLV